MWESQCAFNQRYLSCQRSHIFKICMIETQCTAQITYTFYVIIPLSRCVRFPHVRAYFKKLISQKSTFQNCYLWALEARLSKTNGVHLITESRYISITFLNVFHSTFSATSCEMLQSTPKTYGRKFTFHSNVVTRLFRIPE